MLGILATAARLLMRAARDGGNRALRAQSDQTSGEFAR